MLNSKQNCVEMAGVFWPAGTNVVNTLLFLQVAQHSCFYAENEVVITWRRGPVLFGGCLSVGEGWGEEGLPSLDYRLCSMVDPLVIVVVALVTKLCLILCDPMTTVAHQAPLSMGFPRQ